MADSPRLCPDCRTLMSGHDIRNLRIDLCDGCGGVWFDAGEFGRISRLGSRAVDAILATEPPNLTPIAGEHGQSCPVCAVPLSRYHFAGSSPVMLAGCSACAGIFLAYEDLMKLDDRDQQLEGRKPGVRADLSGSVAQLDGLAASDAFRARLAQYNWQELAKPVPFT